MRADTEQYVKHNCSTCVHSRFILLCTIWDASQHARVCRCFAAVCSCCTRGVAFGERARVIRGKAGAAFTAVATIEGSASTLTLERNKSRTIGYLQIIARAGCFTAPIHSKRSLDPSRYSCFLAAGLLQPVFFVAAMAPKYRFEFLKPCQPYAARTLE